jgi:hypothetical protein
LYVSSRASRPRAGRAAPGAAPTTRPRCPRTIRSSVSTRRAGPPAPASALWTDKGHRASGA